MRRSFIITTVLALILVSAPSRAQNNRFNPQALADTIAPLLDEMALVVVHVNLERVDLAPLEQRVLGLIESMGMSPEEAAWRKKEMTQAFQFPRDWAARAITAGARDVYIVVTMADFPRWPVYFVVPVPQGADAKAIEALFDGEESRQNQLVTQARDGKVVWGTAQLHERLKAQKQPQARPELAKAFEAAGNAAIQVAFVPTADARRVLTELMPDVPLPTGAIEGSTFGQGVQWAALGVNLAPNVSLNLTIQSPDTGSAKALHDALTKLLAAANAGVAGAVAGEPKVKEMIGDLDALAAALRPRLAGDRLTLALDADAAMKFTGLLAPAVSSGRTAANRVKSASNMRQIITGCLLYANENKGHYPPDLKTVFKTQDVGRDVMKNPTMPWKDVGYVYLKPVMNQKAPAEQVILWENHDLAKLGKTDRLNVGFHDAHVELMPKETFERRLAESIDRNDKALAEQR